MILILQSQTCKNEGEKLTEQTDDTYQMDSNLFVELYITKRSCQDLFKELSNNWVKNSGLDNHDFFNLEGLG